MILMVGPNQSQDFKSLGFFHSEQGILLMINITAKPTWQWSGKNTSTRSISTRTSNAGASALKQALMPSSLDLDFSLKYRR
jgi:hypothetical protein